MKTFHWVLQHLFAPTIFTIVFAGMLLFAPTGALAHGGRLNKCGCHLDHRYNPPQCHCHQPPYGGCGRECYSRRSDGNQTTTSSECSVADELRQGFEATATDSRSNQEPEIKKPDGEVIWSTTKAKGQSTKGRVRTLPTKL